METGKSNTICYSVEVGGVDFAFGFIYSNTNIYSMQLNVLNELRVRYFTNQDREPVHTTKRLEATLVAPDDGEPFWIPNTQIYPATIVNKETGEITFEGYWISEWWLRRKMKSDPDIVKRLRRAAFDYVRGGIPLGPDEIVYKGRRWTR